MTIEKIEQIIAKLATGRGVVLLIIVGAIAFFVVKNFSFLSKVTFELTPEKIAKGEMKKPIHTAVPQDIQLRRVHVPPVVLELPPYFLAEFVNNSNFPAKNVEFLIDLGASTAEKTTLRPKDKCSLGSQEDLSQIRVICSGLNSKESVFVQAALSLPIYRKITISQNGVIAGEIWASGDIDKPLSKTEFADVLIWGVKAFVVVVGAILLIVLGVYIVSTFNGLCESAFSRKRVADRSKDANPSK